MHENPLAEIQQYGQSIWLDFLHRRILDSGELKRLIEEDKIRGVTSNPAIFQKAIGGSDVYDAEIRRLASKGKSTEEIYQTLIVEDIQRAADLFRQMYDKSEGQHGFVSLEVNPHLAHKTDESIAEARKYWSLLDRPNVLIKIPATKEGLPAISRLISQGINVNVTLLFGLPQYRQVAEAYISGLEERQARGGPLPHVSSVASFFLSRIDVLVDPILQEKKKGGDRERDLAVPLIGQVAIASAKQAYRIYKELFTGERFSHLGSRGARPQRVLWASTSTKNPGYSDIKYVEPLIGPETINTLPEETLDAYRDHGKPAARLEEDIDRSEKVLADLAAVGIDIEQVTRQLEDEGVEKFNKPFDKLMQSIEQRSGETAR
jgi:transaldolase